MQFEVKKEFLGIPALMQLHPKSKLPLIEHYITARSDRESLERISACLLGDDEKEKAIISSLVTKPIEKANGVTSLHIYAAYGCIDAVRTFHDLGADPTAIMTTQDGELLTPLMLAARYNHVKIVSRLAPINALDVIGEQNLITVCKASQNPTTLAKIKFEFDVTPLHIYCTLGYLNSVKALLKLNVNKTELMTAPDESKYSPIMLAALFKHDNIAELLVRQLADVNTKELEDQRAPTVLEIYTRDQNHKMVQLLLDKGVNPNYRYHNLNKTALYHAVTMQDPEMCEMLLFAGAETKTVMQFAGEEVLGSVMDIENSHNEIKSLLNAFSDIALMDLDQRIAQHICRAMKEAAVKDKAGIKSAEYSKGATLLKAVLLKEGIEARVNLVKAHFISLPKVILKGYDFSLFDQSLAKLLIADPDFCQHFGMNVSKESNFTERKTRVTFVEALQKQIPALNELPLMEEEAQPQREPDDVAEPDERKTTNTPGFFQKLKAAFSSNSNAAEGPPLAPATNLLISGDEDDAIRSSTAVLVESKAAEPTTAPADEPAVMVGQLESIPTSQPQSQDLDTDSEDYISSYNY